MNDERNDEVVTIGLYLNQNLRVSELHETELKEPPRILDKNVVNPKPKTTSSGNQGCREHLQRFVTRRSSEMDLPEEAYSL